MLTQAETKQLARRLGTGYGLAFLGAILWLILEEALYWLYLFWGHGSAEGQFLTVLIPGIIFFFLTFFSLTYPRKGSLFLLGAGLIWLLVQLVAGCILLLEVQMDRPPFFIEFILYPLHIAVSWIPVGITYGIALFSPLVGSFLIYTADKRLQEGDAQEAIYTQE